MRIRTVKPEFFLHEKLFDLERETGLPVRLAYAGLWCAADREGRFKWEPRRLKAEILPYDDLDFSRVLDALTTRGFLERYASGGVDYAWIPTFKKHQFVNPREKPSELPEPIQVSNDQSLDACSTRDSRVLDACPTRPSLPIYVPKKSSLEGKSAEKGNGKVPFEEVRLRLCVLFKRKAESPWGNDEEHYLMDVVKRPEVLPELSEIESFFSRGTFLPRTLRHLLQDWTNQLDRARNDPVNDSRNTKPEPESIAVQNLNKELKKLERERSRNASSNSAL